jgi:transposase
LGQEPKKEISNGAGEGLHNKIRVVTRRSYGFRTYEAMEIALYHTWDDSRNQNLPTDSAEEDHCDNGSEFINYTVAKLLNKLLVEFTKSRAYRTTDNALVEGKNGAVVRKHIGYGPIAAPHAEAFQKFYTAHLNPYLNYHRPCGFATMQVRSRGKRRRLYRAEDYHTPYEKLISLAQWEQYLKPGITAAYLATQAGRRSDTEAARSMQKAKLAVLSQCRRNS